MPLPKPPAEVPVVRDLHKLAPKFREKVELVLQDMRAWGYTPLLFETLRTDERQRFIYGFGRTYDDGRGIVTNSQAGWDSWHFFGLAADIICARNKWNAPRDFWETLGTSARRHGLVWGADWNGNWASIDERFVDRPHIQWGEPMRRSPSSNAIELYRSGGVEAVWKVVKAAA